MLAQSDDGKVEAGVLSYAAHNEADISQNNAWYGIVDFIIWKKHSNSENWVLICLICFVLICCSYVLRIQVYDYIN